MTNIRNIADEVASALAYAKQSGTDQLIVTPLLYPSGSMVVVRMDQGPEGYFVSDYGCGAREISMMGSGDRTFRRLAKKASDAYGIRFTDDLFFDTDVPREALVTAVISVANASKTCVEQTALAVAAAERDTRRELLWSHLETAFPGSKIVRGAEVNGASDRWEFDASLQRNDHQVLFEIVSPTGGSVNAAVTKFLDVRDLGADVFGRVAVTVDREKTPHLALLARNARIVGLRSPASEYAAAA